jgi:hypothetical protein
VVNQPNALSLGFCVNVVGPQASPRTRHGSDTIIERMRRHDTCSRETGETGDRQDDHLLTMNR